MRIGSTGAHNTVSSSQNWATPIWIRPDNDQQTYSVGDASTDGGVDALQRFQQIKHNYPHQHIWQDRWQWLSYWSTSGRTAGSVTKVGVQQRSRVTKRAKNNGYEESGVDFAWETEQFKNLTQGFQR